MSDPAHDVLEIQIIEELKRVLAEKCQQLAKAEETIAQLKARFRMALDETPDSINQTDYKKRL